MVTTFFDRDHEPEMAHRVLLLGGHGKVALYMTRELLKRSWQVTSIVRNPDHRGDIQLYSKGQPGELSVLTRSLDDVTDEDAAQAIIDEARPDVVIWSAGAGGKGGANRTYAIDRDAAIHFIKASAKMPSIKKFLMISWIGSRRHRAPWWNDEDEKGYNEVWEKLLPDFAKAKIEADECLTAMGALRKDFQTICLRPGTLKDEPATGKVMLGQTPARGPVTREDVADVAIRLLESSETRGYYDLINGKDPVEDAVQKAITIKVDCFQGEDLPTIISKYHL